MRMCCDRASRVPQKCPDVDSPDPDWESQGTKFSLISQFEKEEPYPSHG